MSATKEELMIAIAFFLHVHVGNVTHLENLELIQMNELTVITRLFLRKYIPTIEKLLSMYGCVVKQENDALKLYLLHEKSLVDIFIDLKNDYLRLYSNCSKKELLHTQIALFEDLFIQMNVKQRPVIKYCDTSSYTWSVNDHTICLPSFCEQYIQKEWSSICPEEWLDLHEYAYEFRMLSVPLHEIIHLNQDHLTRFEDEWDASYQSLIELKKLNVNKTNEFALEHWYMFLLFHESLVRNLLSVLPKKLVQIIDKWHMSHGKVDGMTPKDIAILENSIINATDKKLNTFAKTLVSLHGVFDRGLL